jgi:hypothetical protein
MILKEGTRMPYTISWEEPSGLYVTFSGVVAPADFARIVKSTIADPRFEHLRYTITDYLDAEGHAFTAEDLEAIAEAIANRVHAAYAEAQVLETAVTADPALRAFLIDYSAVVNHPVRIFSTVGAARCWLAGQAYMPRKRGLGGTSYDAMLRR